VFSCSILDVKKRDFRELIDENKPSIFRAGLMRIFQAFKKATWRSYGTSPGSKIGKEKKRERLLNNLPFIRLLSYFSSMKISS
jgi:hypothetical protein